MISVTRDTVHPWSGSLGWDRLEIRAAGEEPLNAMLSDAEEKLWRVFERRQTFAILYKPSGATEKWCDDEHWLGHDKEKARMLQTGDVVYTNFSGGVTRHKIVERQDVVTSWSGVSVRVSPSVPRSGGGWMDAGWFRKIL